MRRVAQSLRACATAARQWRPRAWLSLPAALVATRVRRGWLVLLLALAFLFAHVLMNMLCVTGSCQSQQMPVVTVTWPPPPPPKTFAPMVTYPPVTADPEYAKWARAASGAAHLPLEAPLNNRSMARGTEVPLNAGVSSVVPLTIITTPRDFGEPIVGQRQRAVALNWIMQNPRPEVVYVSEFASAQAVAREFNFKYSSTLEKDQAGYDRLDSFLKEGQRLASSDVVMMLNADCFLGSHFLHRLNQVLVVLLQSPEPFLVTGMRYTWPIGQADYDPTRESLRDFEVRNIENRTFLPLRSDALDFFVFRKGSYDSVLPPFRIGRSRWDNWLMSHATTQGWNTVCGGAGTTPDEEFRKPCLYVVHPEHTRDHQKTGEEALFPYQRNTFLADQAGGILFGRMDFAVYELRDCSPLMRDVSPYCLFKMNDFVKLK